jgi:membrane protease YdiL (CAAX protease family)
VNSGESPSPFGELPAISETAPEMGPSPEPVLQSRVRAIPEDLSVPWGAFDVVLLIVLTLVGTLLLGVVRFLAAGLFGITSTMIQKSVRDQSVISIIAQVIADFGVLGYLAIHIRSAFGLPFWKTIGWRKLATEGVPKPIAVAGLVMGGAMISLLVDAASNLHPPGKTLPMEAVFQDRLSSLLFLLMAVLLAPVMEETVFRGYLYPVVARSWGVVAGVLVTGTLFGLLHGFQLGGAWWQVSLLVMVGAIFTWIRAATKTVLASYLLHLGYNSFLFVAFLVQTHFLRTMPPAH